MPFDRLLSQAPASSGAILADLSEECKKLSKVAEIEVVESRMWKERGFIVAGNSDLG